MNRNFLFHSLACAAAFALLQPAESAGASTSLQAGTRQSASQMALGFATPQQAVSALQAALAAKDMAALRALFGSGVDNLINPDLVQATNEFNTVAAALAETNRLVAVNPRRMIIEFGRDATPFAVPLAETAGTWAFDTEAGTEELINRRIGRNELAVLDAIRTYVEAQREYASYDRDGDQVLEYAQRFASTPGTKDGLYWPLDLDGSMSPLGPLVADAQAEGYRKKTDQPEPFHGYYFRILTQQGKNAPGGAYDYVINRNMIGGFALVAWPAQYDRTGVMTFVVNQQGRVYQKDLGARTGKTAEGMKVYNPDATWRPSKD